MRLATIAGLLGVLLASGGAQAEGNAARVKIDRAIQCSLEDRTCLESSRGTWLADDAEVEWAIDEVRRTRERTFVQWRPKWNNLRMVGTTAVFTYDNRGILMHLDRGAARFEVENSGDMGVGPAQATAVSAVQKRVGPGVTLTSRSAGEKVVLVDGDVGVVAYEVPVSIPEKMKGFRVYVNAGTGQVVWIQNAVIR